MNSTQYGLSASAVFLGLVFGILMPFLANYFPGKETMDQELRQSLDITKRTKDEFGVKIQKLEDIGISGNQLIASIMLVVLGFTTYYFVPLAFLTGRTTLAILLLNMVLILVIIGLTFICTLLFEHVEHLLLWISMHTCCRKERHLNVIVQKNLLGHRQRNTKTSIMFTLSISFLIFSSSTFKLVQLMIFTLAKSLIGTDLYANAP